ncbi:hypothetical protein S7711_06696 [Stachybotrys chartarum IBT 7711]|uniref:Uncharacterized protein n=1 Tax=Stachybotrys chartarum (strain CBS 109288 / IBT 7711) TaxID=1280523 RepID=A0A084APJ8_STACB|nr:hypothetical protein S7711_06696 [Stachybotrys chartarum IBT 7711]KFA47323.1 hypothetical protein S40293_06046 [Stachybotrys chartarum IBT 40293]
MDPSFTHAEKRFVLAEMIKASCVDIDNLALFIRSNEIKPDWMNMQLPLGRNMNQCMQIAEHLAIPSTLKRKPASDWSEPHPKRVATTERADQPRPLRNSMTPSTVAASPGPHIAILPRPGRESLERPPPPQIPPLPKKRGRPSRADKAKRDLRPILPQQIAPRPVEKSHSQSSSPIPPHHLLPPVVSVQHKRAQTPPIGYGTTPAIEEAPPTMKQERPSSADAPTGSKPLAPAAPEVVERTPPSPPLQYSPAAANVNGPITQISPDATMPKLPSLPSLHLVKAETFGQGGPIRQAELGTLTTSSEA